MHVKLSLIVYRALNRVIIDATHQADEVVSLDKDARIGPSTHGGGRAEGDYTRKNREYEDSGQRTG